MATLIRDRAVRIDPATRRAALQLLREWDRPSRLSANTLFRALANHGVDVQTPEAIQRCLLQAIGLLDGRERIILYRCDILHELHDDVHRALGMSRRQFYRERGLAIEHVAQILLGLRSAPASVKASGLDLAFARAHALEQLGRWVEAAELLETVVHEHVNDLPRIAGFCRLVQLHARAGRPAFADSYLRLARGEVVSSGVQAQISDAIVDVAEAERSLAFSPEDDAESACRRATPILRQGADADLDVLLSETLAQALMIESQIALERGKFDGFISCARESEGVIARLSRPNRVVAHEVNALVAYSRLFDGSTQDRAEAELWKNFGEAVDQSLLRQAAVVACSLARLYTRAGRAERSFQIANDMLPTARVCARGEPLTVLLLEASEAAYWLGDPDVARSFLDEAKNSNPQGRLCNHIDLAKAHLYLEGGCFREALAHAESAEAGLVRMKRTRYAACALRLQAEALAGLGERRRALRTAIVAAEMLERVGTPFAQRRALDLIEALRPQARSPLERRNAIQRTR